LEGGAFPEFEIVLCKFYSMVRLNMSRIFATFKLNTVVWT
jgi:hypothetical protein